MDDSARRMLRELISTYGNVIGEDSRRFEALMRDLCPGSKREIASLTSAAMAGVPGEILSAPDGIPSEMLRARLSKRLQNDFALSPDAADWAVESWMDALAHRGKGVSCPTPTKSKAGLDGISAGKRWLLFEVSAPGFVYFFEAVTVVACCTGIAIYFRGESFLWFGIPYVGLMLLAEVVRSALASKVSHANGEDVFYAEQATQADAVKLCDRLVSEGYFNTDGSPKSVRVIRNGNALTIAFVVRDASVANDPKVVSLFRNFQKDLEKTTFSGANVRIELCDGTWEALKTLP